MVPPWRRGARGVERILTCEWVLSSTREHGKTRSAALEGCGRADTQRFRPSKEGADTILVRRSRSPKRRLKDVTRILLKPSSYSCMHQSFTTSYPEGMDKLLALRSLLSLGGTELRPLGRPEGAPITRVQIHLNLLNALLQRERPICNAHPR